MASSSRLLLLRRGDHNSRLTEGFESLLDKEMMTDVSITCGQQIIRAHRTVLSIFSPFFKRVFDSVQNPMHYPFIVLKDMPYSDLMAIIDLMYRGEVTVTQDQFTSLKSSAKVLEVSELSDIISSYEEKNDIKPKIEDNITSSARNTRKRGRPRRYVEESDDDYRVEDDTPPPTTKRQLALQSSRAASASSKKTIVQTITPASKMSIATKGGAHLSFSKQPNIRLPTGTRGGHSAFSKPQTAIRGGHTAVAPNKPQIATRGKWTNIATCSRGRPTRQSVQEIDVDFHPSQEMTRRSSGRRGRPPRTASLTREDNGMPMATSLPLSLPEPIQLSLEVDLENIYPDYNLNDVSSSTSSAQKVTVPVQFEQAIKQEPDSDSEVECIMSGTSPLPSGVMEDALEITQTSTNKQLIEANPQPEPQNVSAEDQRDDELPVSNSSDQREMATESIRHEIISVDEPEVESHILDTNILIKTERRDSPVPQILDTTERESSVSGVSKSSEISLNLVSNVDQSATATCLADNVSESVPVTTSESTVNSQMCGTSIPLLRFIKTERISPSNAAQTSFQPIDGQTNSQTNSCESQESSGSTVPTLTRVKMERTSPKDLEEDNCDQLIENKKNGAVNESSDVSSSHNPVLSVQITNVFSENQSPSPTQSDRQRMTDVTTNDNTECTSSSSQPTTDESCPQQNTADNRSADNELDVQDIAFDCFYSNDDQQMQTYTTGATTSSVSSTPNDINSFIGYNNGSENIINNQNTNDFNRIANNTNQMTCITTPETHSIIRTSDPTQQQFFAINTNQQQISNIPNSNSFSLDNNVVMNSPLHSDEECMLLDSPQESAVYEVTIGSEPNLDDSMDNI